jgi:hypothetical protein
MKASAQVAEKPRRKMGPKNGLFAGGKISPQDALDARYSVTHRELVDACRKLTPRALAKITEILERPDVADRDAIRAVELLLSYGFGKPNQSLSLEVSRGPDIQELSRDSLMGALARAAAREGIPLGEIGVMQPLPSAPTSVRVIESHE